MENSYSLTTQPSEEEEFKMEKAPVLTQPTQYEEIPMEDMDSSQYPDANEGTSKAPTTGFGLADAAIQMATPSDTPNMSDKELNDIAMNAIGHSIKGGSDVHEAFNSTDRPDFYKGLYYKKLTDGGMEPEKASIIAGVRPEQVERANQHFLNTF